MVTQQSEQPKKIQDNQEQAMNTLSKDFNKSPVKSTSKLQSSVWVLMIMLVFAFLFLVGTSLLAKMF